MSLFGFDAASFDSVSVPQNVRENLPDDASRASERSILASVSSADVLAPHPTNDNVVEMPSSIWVELQHTPRMAVSEDDESYGGITILSSVPSSQVSPLFLAGSPHQIPNDEQSIRSGLSYTFANDMAPMLSISTQASPLSLNPSSLASSMTDLSLVSTSHFSDAEPMHRTIDAVSVKSPALAMSSTGCPLSWLQRFQTEQDWDVFCHETKGILAALHDESNESSEILLAQLIEQEERLFWSRKKGICGVFQSLQQRGLLLLGETLLVAAVAAAFGTHSHGVTTHRVA